METENPVKNSKNTEFKPGVSGNPAGRPKGSRNKVTSLLKDAILQAAEQAGGEDGLVGYLETQAVEQPVAFMGLLGKVLPLQLAGSDDSNDLPTEIKFTLVKPDHSKLNQSGNDAITNSQRRSF